MGSKRIITPIAPGEKRAQFLDRTEVLTQVAPLADHDGLSTTAEVAEWYGITMPALSSIVNANRDEFAAAGRRVLQNPELRDFRIRHGINTHHMGRVLAVYPRRAVLLTGMLAATSERAVKIRQYLLNVEEMAPETVRETAAVLAGITLAELFARPGTTYEEITENPDGTRQIKRATYSGTDHSGGNAERVEKETGNGEEKARIRPVRSGKRPSSCRENGGEKTVSPRWKTALDEYGFIFWDQARQMLNDSLGLSLSNAQTNEIIELSSIDEKWVAQNSKAKPPANQPRLSREAVNVITATARTLYDIT